MFYDSAFVEDLWFKDELFEDELNFEGAEESNNISLQIGSLYEIKEFKNIKIIDSLYEIKEFKNIKISAPFEVKGDFENSLNYAFYKLGLMQIPPIRVVFRNFED